MLDRVNELLRQAADACVWGINVVGYTGFAPEDFEREIFAPRRGGVACGGMAQYFVGILDRTGIEAEMVNLGKVGTGLTHVTVLVHHDGRRFVFDPLYSGRYVGADGCDLDFDRVLSGAPYRFVVNAMRRTFVTIAEIATRRRARFEMFEVPAEWDDAPNAYGFVAAHGFAYTPDYFRRNNFREMAAAGMQCEDDIILWFWRQSHG